jgi:hypothetical protein
VDTFAPKLLQVDGGVPVVLRPVPFAGRIDELTLERWIVERPDLMGEDLLVLGHQLADFEEDRDRLDVLALDRSGEIVLIELKVADEYRVTDLQALAYAGAYAKREPEDLVATLVRHLRKRAEDPDAVTTDDAESAIATFIEVDDLADWRPSQHVRIKLVAPTFPRRVLQTVKWLGDVYSMRLEAITVRLFERGTGSFSLAFERMLPLPSEEQFDMTVREREDRKRQENVTRRPAVLPLLIAGGHLHHGQTLYATPTLLTVEHRDLWDPTDTVFQVRLHAPGGSAPKFVWRPAADEPEELLAPSQVAHRIYCRVVDWDPGRTFSTPVATNFSVEPAGPTLEQLAFSTGVWQ